MSISETKTRKWQPYIISAACFAFIVKLYLALTTIGTNDVLTWQSFLVNIREFGGIGTYQRLGSFGNPFNHSPFMIHVLRVLGFLTDISWFPFSFWIRLPAIIADIGSLWLLSKMKAPRLMLLMFALCPASILISGFHGNTDPLMVFFLLLSIYFLERRGYDWLAGFAFGMALNIKIVPVIFIPLILFYLGGTKRLIQFFSVAFLIGFLGSLPYILIDPVLIARKMLGYGSTYNRWGWSLILSFVFLPQGKLPIIGYDSAILHRFLFTYFRYALVAMIVFLSLLMNRTSKKPTLFFQYGAVTSTFLALTPGFGVQYLAWLIPFVIALGTYRTVNYYLTSGAYLIALYTFWSEGSWYYADSVKDRPPNTTVFLLSLLCWLSVVFCFFKYLRQLSTRKRATSGNADKEADGFDSVWISD